MQKIIGLPVLISSQFRIVLDQGLCRLHGIPEDGAVVVDAKDSTLLISPLHADAEMPAKNVSIGRFNLPVHWAKENNAKVGGYAYLLPTDSGLEVRVDPWETSL